MIVGTFTDHYSLRGHRYTVLKEKYFKTLKPVFNFKAQGPFFKSLGFKRKAVHGLKQVFIHRSCLYGFFHSIVSNSQQCLLFERFKLGPPDLDLKLERKRKIWVCAFEAFVSITSIEIVLVHKEKAWF